MKKQRQTITMKDGRVYVSDDNWDTIFEQLSAGVFDQVVDKDRKKMIHLLVAYGAAE